MKLLARKAQSLGIAVGVCCLYTLPLYADWATYKHDNYRSAVSGKNIDATQLTSDWQWDTGTMPQPAWSGANKKDTYNGPNMVSQRDYDLSFRLISAGSNVFMTSTADDTVYCLSQDTGQIVWKYTSNGPIRNAATYSQGKIYFGSDDGYIYCLNSTDGSLVWKYSPLADSDYKTLFNGRLTSLASCRTGVLVKGNTVYAGFSLLPWDKSYLCALDKNTGQATGEGRYVKEYVNMNMTIEAPFAYSGGRLFIPQGRSKPAVVNAKTGEKLKDLNNRGGCFVLVTPKQKIWHGVSEYRTGSEGFVEVDGKSTLVKQVMKDKSSHPTSGDGSIITHSYVNEMLYWRDTVFMLADDKIQASGKITWTTSVVAPYTFMIAGSTIYAGGTNKIVALNALTGAVIGETAVDGDVHDIIADNSKIFACTSTGQLYVYKQDGGATAAFTTPGSVTPPTAVTPGSLALEAGPSAGFTSLATADVIWKVPPGTSVTKLYFGEGSAHTEVAATAIAGKTDWYKATLTGLQLRKVYNYVVDCDGQKTALCELDSFFNFSLPTVNASLDPFAGKAAATATTVLSKANLNKGIALVVGLDDGSLAYEIAKQSRMRVIAIDTDPAKVAAVREKMLTARVYGALVDVKQVTDYVSMPYPENFANIIVSEAGLTLDSTTISKYLNPYRGCALSGAVTSSTPIQTATVAPDAGNWQHAYGSADNTAYADEGLSTSSKADDFRPQWMGRPGPRFIIDRSGRTFGPIASDGYFCVPGEYRLAALDSRNGSVLWCQNLSGFIRANVPKDCGPMCMDADSTYVAVNDDCLVMDNENGDIKSSHKVVLNSAANPGKNWSYDWDYMANTADKIIGSAVKADSHMTSFDGSFGWYESRSDDAQTAKVCCENLFAINKSTGALAWEYYRDDAVIISSTITLAGGKAYFMQCRNSQVKSLDTRNVLASQNLFRNIYLVAVNLSDGSVSWEKSLADGIEGYSLYHMSATSKYNRLVLVASKTDNRIIGFDMADGTQLWSLTTAWRNSDHGGHMNRPMIVGNKLYVKPSVIDVVSGAEIQRISYPYAKCGTYTAASYCHTQRSAITISGTNSVALFDLQTKTATDWQKLRPSCWLGAIPANGLMLAQETGAGCSCANGWLETSIAFAPKTKPAAMFRYAESTFSTTTYDVELYNLSGTGSEVRYTTDGSTPTAASSLYSGPVAISATTTVKAAVFSSGSQVGQSIERTFTKQ